MAVLVVSQDFLDAAFADMLAGGQVDLVEKLSDPRFSVSVIVVFFEGVFSTFVTAGPIPVRGIPAAAGSQHRRGRSEHPPSCHH